MSADQIDNPVSYEQLEDIEEDFEEVELELLRQQTQMTKDLYTKRAKIVSEIPNFWPLVFEQAPPDIDEYIQPADAAVILSALKGLSVERFELPNGDPRSISIKWEFSENEYFEDKTLEKKFWWRCSKDGWEGLVSEPVPIKWKEGKDLTSGMLDLVMQVWEEEKKNAGKEKEGDTEAEKKLKAQMESTGLGGLSFFAWFGFRGRKVTAEESQEAAKEAADKRKARKEGKEVDVMEEDEDDDDDDDEYELEIFPTADDLAVCISEDLYPSAIKYFLTAQEEDALSDVDFEESDEEMEGTEGAGDSHQDKKRKA